MTNGSVGNITGIATLIFTTYVFPFEVTSALLITAALGAMVLAHRERSSAPSRPSATWPSSRVASGRPTPLPSRASSRCTMRSTCRPCCRTASPSELSVSSMLTRRELGDDGTPALPPVPEESGGPDFDNPAAPAGQ